MIKECHATILCLCFCVDSALFFQWNLSSVKAPPLEEDELVALQTSGDVVNSQEILAATLSGASMNMSGDQVCFDQD